MSLRDQQTANHTRTVDMHISMLRKKLGEDSRHPALLVTVHGVGYMMTTLAQAV